MTDSLRFDAPGQLRRVRTSLIELLRALTDQQWEATTAAAPWQVRDIAAHLVGDDVGRLSRGRDGHAGPAFRDGETLPIFLHRINDEWVRAMTRASPSVLLALLETTSREVLDYWESLDLDEVSASVYWAGPGPHPVWLDCAREVTEDWVHQQQIREAVGVPGLDDDETMRDVLDTFLHAVPYTLQRQGRDEGSLTIAVTGVGAWSWHGANGQWDRTPEAGVTTLRIEAETLWRLAVRMIGPSEARSRSNVTGDESLAVAALQLVSIIR